jgi:hypothetical protein
MSIMPIWSDLTMITYVPMTDLSLSRTIGLRWRKQQMMQPLEWFCNFATEHDWQIAAPLQDIQVDNIV